MLRFVQENIHSPSRLGGRVCFKDNLHSHWPSVCKKSSEGRLERVSDVTDQSDGAQASVQYSGRSLFWAKVRERYKLLGFW